nr:plant intracellular Ras-group-related LRR protein 4-like [Ipomoea trifida]
MGTRAVSIEEVVEEIMRLHRSLPARPGIDDVEAAKSLVANVEREDQLKIDAISRQRKGKDVPEELFKVLQEMQRSMVQFQSKEQKREALKLLDLENAHLVFDDLVQRASKCLPSNSHTIYPSSNSSTDSSTLSLTNSASVSGSSFGSPATTATTSSFYNEREPLKASEFFSKDDSYLMKAKSAIHVDGIGVVRYSDAPSIPKIVDSTLMPSSSSSHDSEKLSLIKLASLIEVSAKKGTLDLNLQSKLSEQVEWLPDSIGKLSSLITLDLSENRLIALPTTIGGLASLQKLNLSGNRIAELPDSVGDLLKLISLDLGGNHLKSLPVSIARLVNLQELDLSSNMLSSLPETIGCLVSLKRLIVETNDLEELPHTIGQCSSLVELRADYNRLKALPEAVGRIKTLEILSVRYNNVRQLPTTMASMENLKELNVSFNELESVPESMCFATTLVKLNVSNNFADLQSLPRSIGNLEMLEELDISNNQIRVLPDSFRMLSKLSVLKTEGNPLEIPPADIVAKGAKAVVQYMADLHAMRNMKAAQPVKQKKSWAQKLFSRSRANKQRRVEYVQT